MRKNNYRVTVQHFFPGYLAYSGYGREWVPTDNRVYIWRHSYPTMEKALAALHRWSDDNVIAAYIGAHE